MVDADTDPVSCPAESLLGDDFSPSTQEAKAVKHRRLLILCREDHFEEVKAVCLKAMPDLEFVNLWDLDVERVMDAICRKNQMKGFTDYRFLLPRCPL